MKRVKCPNCRRMVRPMRGRDGYSCPMCGWYGFATCDDAKCSKFATDKCEMCDANCCDQHLTRVKRGWHGARHKVIFGVDPRQTVFDFARGDKTKTASNSRRKASKR